MNENYTAFRLVPSQQTGNPLAARSVQGEELAYDILEETCIF